MKVRHVTIQVKDLEKSIEFYRKTANIDIQLDLRPTGSPIVFLADDKAATKMELIENPDNAFCGNGISVGFQVEDIEAEHERLAALGFELTPMIAPNPATKFFFVTDPDGFKVQLIK